MIPFHKTDTLCLQRIPYKMITGTPFSTLLLASTGSEGYRYQNQKKGSRS